MAEGPGQGPDASAFGDDRSGVSHTHTGSLYAYKRQVESVSDLREYLYVPDNETTGEALNRLRVRADLTFRELATEAGYTHASGIQRYLEASFVKPLSTSVAQRMVKALAGKGSPPIEDSEVFALTGIPAPNATLAPPMEGAGTDRMVRDVPIFGTALGADEIIEGEAIEQTTLNTGEVVGYVRRPVLLNGRTDVYSLYVQGSSMHPRFRDGALIFVETKRQPSVGDDCVVHLRTEQDDDERISSVLVKALARKSASYLELEQYSPALTFRIPTQRIAKVHRVIPWDELVA